LALKASHLHLEAVVKLVADQELTLVHLGAADSNLPAADKRTALALASGSGTGGGSGGSGSLTLRPLGIMAAAEANPAAAQALLRSLHGLAIGAEKIS
jgi:hypothetical protein